MLLFGLSESGDTPTERCSRDVDRVMKIFAALHIDDKTLVWKCFRIGQWSESRPRPLKLCFESEEDKMRILRQSSRLSKLDHSDPLRKVFIRRDMTKSELLEDKERRQELKTRRENGEDVIIRRGKVVPRKARAHEFSST